jgi:signal transduction histidine kinase
MGMRERGLAIGGEVTFISNPGQGTIVRTIIPIAGRDPAAPSPTT